MKQLSMTAAQIAEKVHGTIYGDPQRVIGGISGIRDAAADQLSFVGSKKYEDQLNQTKAGIILVCRDLASAAAENRTIIACDNVDYAFAGIAALFASIGLSVNHLQSGTEVSDADKLVDWSLGVAQSAKTGLRMTMAVIPILGLIVAFFWFRKRYILTDEKVEEIAAEVKARHAE